MQYRTETSERACVSCNSPLSERKWAAIESAATAGIEWLLALQNWDGGMPTFCRGWGALPFDKSSTDITAHAIRAFQAWRKKFGERKSEEHMPSVNALMRKMQRSEERMFAFLEREQQKNGSWLPLWFGNQFLPDDANPYYGTAKVLLALAETKREHAMTFGGLRYLISTQNADGGWGCQRVADENQKKSGNSVSGTGSSVEETSVVVEALALYADRAEVGAAYRVGLNWLLEAVESDRFLRASPIGLYFAKLWYYEDLYPVIFTTSALRQALKTAQQS